MGSRKQRRKNRAFVTGKQVLFLLLTVGTAQAEELIPLPSDISTPSPAPSNPVMGLADRLIGSAGNTLTEQLPNSLSVDSDNGAISYDQEKNLLRYAGGEQAIHMKSDTGADFRMQAAEVDLTQQLATLQGPITLCKDEMMVRASGNGTFRWTDNQVTLNGVRAKVNGLIVRGSSVEYGKDAEGKDCVTIHDAYVTTEDVQKPTSWIGTGTLTIYPGDSGKISRLSIAGSESDMAVPVFGWFTFSHSLNPREGYLPGVGSKSLWGGYMQNSYGILLGHRHTHGLMPTADYLATLHADYRTRRGLAGGLDFENVEETRFKTKLSTYFLDDTDPGISPLNTPRKHLNHERYRVTLQTDWNMTPEDARRGERWNLVANVNVLSDTYVLRDFFEDLYRTEDKPDNTVRLTRRTDRTESTLYTRFGANNFYQNDHRVEASFYHVRTPIGNTGISYETNNRASYLRQYLPVEQKLRYEQALSSITDNELRDFYTRQLNTGAYFRLNTTHEVSTSYKALGFLNITPKAGGGYSGYYDVGGVGADNRFLGYAGCDFDFKLHRDYSRFSYDRLGLKGLTHIIHPYSSISHTNITSSNPLVPRVDSWSSVMGSSTSSPMPLDLCGFTGIDGWGSWDIWRIGLQNIFNSEADGDRVRVLDWNSFVDYNLDNPNTESRFSNAYTVVTFHPSERLSMSMETQFPLFGRGDDFSQYRFSVAYQPVAWWEGRVDYTTIKGHPVQKDSEQLYLQSNLRLNEKYTVSTCWNWDIEYKRIPLQQYSVFRNSGAWYIGATFYIRNNGGKQETGFGISFTLGETGTALPIHLY